VECSQRAFVHLGCHMEHITTDIGSRIRHAREQRGLTIRDIANTTKISTAALNAIEHNDFTRLPGGVFRRAYVRAFATEVGLDADELTREYRSRFEIETPAGPIPPQKADWSDRVPALYRLGIVLVTVAMLIGAVVIQQRAQILHESQDERSTLSAVETDLPEDTVPTNESGTEEVAVANAAVSETGAPSVRLEIRLHGPCWVSAVADGERVVYRLMQPGERALVEAHSLITLHVGDAGAVAYSINGTRGKPLGANGEVVTVRITRENLGSLSAEPTGATPAKGAAQIRSGSVGRRVQASQRAVAA
jgi:transcriptional regulator with XRE-family HTH domain